MSIDPLSDNEAIPEDALGRQPQRTVLADDVYEIIRESLISQRIAPGSRLNLDELARKLHVSNTPVRQALARLESDCLVTKEPYLIVSLDEACRRQQVSEGWFPRVDDVPRTAVTMSIAQMLAAREIVVVVPDARKAPAVWAALEGDISPAVPASILRTHPHVTMFLDEAAAGGRGAELARLAASGDGPPRIVTGEPPER